VSRLPVNFSSRASFFIGCLVLAGCLPASAQINDSNPNPALSPAMFGPVTTCNPWIIQTLPVELSFRQRFCLELAKVASPGTILGAGVLAGYAQWRNNPSIRPHDADDFSIRYMHAYERQAARGTAELFVGYLHHEDPRFHPSKKQGTWHRTGAALLGVLASSDKDRGERINLAPIAGALGSGLTTMALYQQKNSLSYGLERSGTSYGFYFVRALVHEFSPELWNLAPGFIRKRHESVGRAFTL
jgi:hypothetical protein